MIILILMICMHIFYNSEHHSGFFRWYSNTECSSHNNCSIVGSYNLIIRMNISSAIVLYIIIIIHDYSKLTRISLIIL